MIDFIKAIILGIVEGITEWLPISSTGHMILVDEFLKLNVTPQFLDVFLVVTQLGAILAVVILYWGTLWPFGYNKGITIKKEVFSLWFKVLVACVPAAVVGLLWSDEFKARFYNPVVVAVMLILFGVLFIIIENYNKNRVPSITKISQLTYKSAVIIGVFQIIAAVFPGTSRSGATIVGALLIGISREVAAEFTFFLGIPVMFGASMYELIKFKQGFAGNELAILLVATLTSFLVSLIAIKFLIKYIKKHDFKIFGYYRIILGILVLAYFGAVKK